MEKSAKVTMVRLKTLHSVGVFVCRLGPPMDNLAGWTLGTSGQPSKLTVSNPAQLSLTRIHARFPLRRRQCLQVTPRQVILQGQ